MAKPWRCRLRLHHWQRLRGANGQWYRECRGCGKQRIDIYKEGPRPSEGLRLHDLRHSAATLALAAGANTRELMERMGHTSPAVALRYQHVMAGRDQAIAAALDELVQAAVELPSEKPSGTLVARSRRAKSEGLGRRAGDGR